MDTKIDSAAPGSNLAIIKSIYEAFEKRDFPLFFSVLAPDISILQCPELPFGGSFTGIEGATTFFGKVRSYLDSHVTIESVIDAGDRIALIGRTYGTVNSNQNTFDVPILHFWGFKDGLANRLEIALDVQKMQDALNNA